MAAGVGDRDGVGVGPFGVGVALAVGVDFTLEVGFALGVGVGVAPTVVGPGVGVGPDMVGVGPGVGEKPNAIPRSRTFCALAEAESVMLRNPFSGVPLGFLAGEGGLKVRSILQRPSGGSD